MSIWVRNAERDLKRDGYESSYRAYRNGATTKFFSDFTLRLAGLPFGSAAPLFLDDATVDKITATLEDAKKRKRRR